MASAPEDDKSFGDIFQKKYAEFCDDLEATVPDLAAQIQAARGLSVEKRPKAFQDTVLPGASPMRSKDANPGTVLPGVVLTDEIWASLSESSKSAIQQYLTILAFCSLYDIGRNDLSGNFNAKAWSEIFLKDWKDKLGSIDFDTLSQKLASMFSGQGAAGFKIPERFLKGHIAKLAEEIVSEFKPEDFGLDQATMEALESNPARAFELLMNIYTNKPDVLQNAMKRIIKRLQEKFKRGELRPEQIAAEAEELMKEFSENSAFVELMETFRSTFGMHDMDMAREVGRENDARRNLVRERLRKKLEKKKAQQGGK